MENKKTYKIIRSTEKAHLLQIDKVEFWIPKAWIKSDQTLSQKAMEAYKEASEKRKTPSREVDIEPLLDDTIQLGHDFVNLTYLKLEWLREITSLLHENLEGVDVWGRISKAIKTGIENYEKY